MRRLPRPVPPLQDRRQVPLRPEPGGTRPTSPRCLHGTRAARSSANSASPRPRWLQAQLRRASSLRRALRHALRTLRPPRRRPRRRGPPRRRWAPPHRGHCEHEMLGQRRSFLTGAALHVGELTAADAAMSLKIAMTVRVHLAPLLINTAPSDSEGSAILQCRCYVVLWHSKVPPRARGSPRGARRWRRRSRAGRGGSSRSSSR